jgi:hypothetical protein
VEQAGDLVGVDAVVLGLAAVDGFHVQRVADEEGDVFLGAAVGQPVPAEHALDADNEVVAEGGDGSEESVKTGWQVVVVNDVADGAKDAQVQL